MELIRGLRSGGAPGVTALRGIWGYHGDHEPHGDRLLALARRVPVVVAMVDDADRASRLFDEVFDPLTAEAGLVTSEWVPVAERATLEV
jgi:PII-like signaling protein